MKNILILIAIIFIQSCTTTEIPEGSNLLSFNSEHWKRLLIDKEKIILKNDDRQKMLSDLLNNVLIEVNKSEVIKLLGPSDYDKFTFRNNHLTYVTGWSRSDYSIDGEWLIIYFDESNKMISFEILED